MSHQDSSINHSLLGNNFILLDTLVAPRDVYLISFDNQMRYLYHFVLKRYVRVTSFVVDLAIALAGNEYCYEHLNLLL